MKEKAFELIKNLTLNQSAAMGGSPDTEAIKLAVDIYCELAEIDKEKFMNKLLDIYHSLWDKWEYKEWEKKQNLYEKLINMLKE